MESIIDLLHKGGYSCVMKNREEVRTFTQRGVADLYDLYQADSAFMKGAAIADKVIGKGAAALMVLGGFKTVYADIISTPALALLCEAGIETTFAQEVPHIINRDKTGWCPLETACMELNTVEEMYPVIQNFISRIRGITNIYCKCYYLTYTITNKQIIANFILPKNEGFGKTFAFILFNQKNGVFLFPKLLSKSISHNCMQNTIMGIKYVTV